MQQRAQCAEVTATGRSTQFWEQAPSAVQGQRIATCMTDAMQEGCPGEGKPYNPGHNT